MYLTTARHPADYAKFLNRHKKAPNPSNQNFHTKLINLLEKSNELIVFSSKPMAKELFVETTNTGIYHYAGYINIPMLKKLGIYTTGQNIARIKTPQVIFVDVMNVTLLELAMKIKRNYKTKVVGVITDNPVNISGSGKSYAQNIFKQSLICDSFIALTNGLERLFNTAKKPYVIIPGFINTPFEGKKDCEEYAFFAGALYPRYGVDNLLAAFKNDKAPLKLLVAGHGPMEDELRKNPHPNIEYIGHVTPEVSFLLAQKAKININPRPKDDQVDLFSVPSKVIDYINSETVTISTENIEIYNLVGDEIAWIHDSYPETIINKVIEVNKDYTKWKQKAEIATKSLRNNLNEQKLNKIILELIQKL